MSTSFGAAVASIFNVTVPSGSAKAKPDIASIYTAQLEVRRHGELIINMDTPLPENFGLHLTSSYDRPFAQPLSETAGEKTGEGQGAQYAENISRATTGITSINKYLSGAVWSSGSTLILTIPFAIVAYDDAYLEVTDKMKKLLQLVAPSEGIGGMLVAPGPNLNTQGVTSLLPGDFTNAVQLGGDEITLNVGRFFRFSPCIINSVDCTFDSQFDAVGNPIAATINVTFEAYWTTTKEDLDKFFAVI
jgi:hypothetical protein